MGTIRGPHHAQATIPPEAEDAARRFYCGVPGLAEIAKPEALAGRGGFWLRVGAQEVHSGTGPGVDRAATGPAAAGAPHLAYAVTDFPGGASAWRTRASSRSTRCRRRAMRGSSSAIPSGTAWS